MRKLRNFQERKKMIHKSNKTRPPEHPLNPFWGVEGEGF